jgi:hypothetical protein
MQVEALLELALRALELVEELRGNLGGLVTQHQFSLLAVAFHLDRLLQGVDAFQVSLW